MKEYANPQQVEALRNLLRNSTEEKTIMEAAGSLSITYLKSGDAVIGKDIAVRMRDRALSKNARTFLYLCLLDISKVDQTSYPNIATFDIEMDIDESLVDSFLV